MLYFSLCLDLTLEPKRLSATMYRFATQTTPTHYRTSS